MPPELLDGWEEIYHGWAFGPFKVQHLDYQMTPSDPPVDRWIAVLAMGSLDDQGDAKDLYLPGSVENMDCEQAIALCRQLARALRANR